jgi:hypothetical protein
MNCRFRPYFATLVILFSLLYFVPVMAAQQEQPSPQSPSVQERQQTPPPEAVTPERTVAETGPISWGSLVFGLIIGGIVGYVLGMGRRHTDVDIRRDRAA